MQDYEDLKLILSRRDREIAEIIKHLGEQETIVGQFRIRPRKKQLDPSPQQERLSPEPTVPDKSKIRSLANKKHLLDELVNEHRRSIADTRVMIKELSEKNITDKQLFEQEILELNENSIQAVENYEAEYMRLKAQIEKYKTCAEIELETRETITTKNNKIILALKEELKSAKEVLKSPNLKSKIHSKLQDYIREEIQSSDNFMKEVKHHTTSISAPYRRNIKSTLEGRRTRKDIREGQLMSLSMDRSNDTRIDESLIGTKVLGMPNGWKLQLLRGERFSNIA